jgi:uncharacterized membrane protein
LTATNAVSGLSQTVNDVNLIVHAPSFTPNFLLAATFELLKTLLNGVMLLLKTTLESILGPLLDNLLDTLVKTLGIEVGKIQVGANLSCYSGRPALVI